MTAKVNGKTVSTMLSTADLNTLVAVTWEQHDSGSSPPVQAPNQLLSLFNGSRQVVYGFADNCTRVTNELSTSFSVVLSYFLLNLFCRRP